MKSFGQRSFDAAHPSTVRSPEVDGSPIRHKKRSRRLLPYRTVCTLPRPRPQERTADSGTNELIIHPVQEESSSNTPANLED
ncbi:hypothetical protein CDEST_12417 [Colletotrichum destructivum]|uniref:Uncharacterized protein n=1 Tax=Colletotrichum destructivum TaxID=34406 RepID=A0AAX4IVX1_9PEZI|nr:hypothetical protein CDEST_12417 [Colletotrichum destructivum]